MENRSILLYDGVCGLCNRAVRFALRHDHADRLRFAALQSALARQVLLRHGLEPDALETVALVANAGETAEHVWVRSDAVVALLSELGGGWKVAATLGRMIPRSVRDAGYAFVARTRYRIFGRYDTCPLPMPKDRHKFLDQ